MDIEFEYADGTKARTRILPVDRIMFERHFGRPVSGDNVREEFIFWLGWHALKRAGRAGDDFDAWLADVVDAETQSEPDPPTDPAANITP